ncbi:MAG: hypothetical protein IJT01_06815 [Selenomonadaceae bacterium]|nr:hypothetical protein [Selenomonadaceae bacterium]
MGQLLIWGRFAIFVLAGPPDLRDPRMYITAFKTFLKYILASIRQTGANFLQKKSFLNPFRRLERYNAL